MEHICLLSHRQRCLYIPAGLAEVLPSNSFDPVRPAVHNTTSMLHFIYGPSQESCPFPNCASRRTCSWSFRNLPPVLWIHLNTPDDAQPYTHPPFKHEVRARLSMAFVTWSDFFMLFVVTVFVFLFFCLGVFKLLVCLFVCWSCVFFFPCYRQYGINLQSSSMTTSFSTRPTAWFR